MYRDQPLRDSDDPVSTREQKSSRNNTDENSDDERGLLVFKTQLCEQAGRFEDMVEAINELCERYDDLSHDEKNLLSCAYKNVIGSRRTSWRILNEYLAENPDLSSKSTNTSNSDQLQSQQSTLSNKDTDVNSSDTVKSDNKFWFRAIVKSFLETIEAELREHCYKIIGILTNRLIPCSSTSGESRVFYDKMKGDYLRYLCEVSPIEERKDKSNESLLAYKTACDKAMIELPSTHPVRLGLMLNLSVFYHDIMKSPERSCRLARQAFEDAIAELDTLSERSYRDSTIIMQLLRDNLKLWESEQNMSQTQANPSLGCTTNPSAKNEQPS